MRSGVRRHLTRGLLGWRWCRFLLLLLGLLLRGCLLLALCLLAFRLRGGLLLGGPAPTPGPFGILCCVVLEGSNVFLHACNESHVEHSEQSLFLWFME